MTNPVNVRGHRTSRRIRWLWRTFEQLRCHLALQLAADDCQQTGSSALATAASVLVVHSRQVLPVVAARYFAPAPAPAGAEILCRIRLSAIWAWNRTPYSRALRLIDRMGALRHACRCGRP